MNRFAALIYGTVCYLIFFGTFLYAIGFLANFGVPKSIDSINPIEAAASGGAPSTLVAMAINLALLSAFALQHSVMARIGFKRWWTRFVPQPVERATYVVASSAVMILLFWGWQPMTGMLFSVESQVARGVIQGFFGLGVATVLYSTFLIDHFDLFGMRQVVLYFRGRPYTDKKFVTPSLYRHIRHPLYLGWFIVFWVTPDITLGHFLIASVVSLYMLVAIAFEERDLGTLLGDDYRAYRARTPMFVPVLARKSGESRPAAQSAV